MSGSRYDVLADMPSCILFISMLCCCFCYKNGLHIFMLLLLELHLISLKAIISLSGLINVAKLIGCDTADLNLALSTRKMRVGNDNIVQKLTLSQVRILLCLSSRS